MQKKYIKPIFENLHSSNEVFFAASTPIKVGVGISSMKSINGNW